MNGLFEFLAGFAIALLAIVIAIYVAQAIFLNKFNKLVYGKGTALAWIPGGNVYLLGKLAINKIVGWILFACWVSTIEFTSTINGVEKKASILPESISNIVSTIYSLAVIIIFIYAIIKYRNMKNNNTQSTQQPNQQMMSQQPIQEMPNQQMMPQQPMQQMPNQQMMPGQPMQQMPSQQMMPGQPMQQMPGQQMVPQQPMQQMPSQQMMPGQPMMQNNQAQNQMPNNNNM